MAVDEALLLSCAGRDSSPLLRVYAWEPPALSLGAHQRAEAAADRAWLAEMGYELVRRPTGGRAVLHADEVTYAFCAPTVGTFGEKGITEVYRMLAGALQRGLARLGVESELVRGRPSPGGEEERDSPTPCFTTPARYELLWRGRKLVGSAQRRVEGAVLQHGSIPLRPWEEGVAMATGGRTLPGGWMAGLEEATGRSLDYEEIYLALREGFAESFGVALEEEGMTAFETERAMRLREGKYATELWTLERVDPLRKARSE
jgi:lipoate-protein ligase A